MEASSRPKKNVNSRDGQILQEEFPRCKIVPEEGPVYSKKKGEDREEILKRTTSNPPFVGNGRIQRVETFIL